MSYINRIKFFSNNTDFVIAVDKIISMSMETKYGDDGYSYNILEIKTVDSKYIQLTSNPDLKDQIYYQDKQKLWYIYNSFLSGE